MWISYLAIPLMVVSSAPKLYKLIKNKDSESVSLSMFLLTLITVTLLFIEALRIENQILIIADSCSIIMLLINIFFIVKYKKSKEEKNRSKV